MEFLDPKLDKYVCDHTEAESPALESLNRKTHLKVLQPRMLSGHFQGRVLSMLMHMIQPERILEIGTYTGYSALCMAEGLKDGGKLITVEANEELEAIIQESISAAGMAHKITSIIGDATLEIPKLNETFDVVFIDADKKNYINYYNLVFPKVKIGGYIIADNVLWSGKVIEEKSDKETDVIKAYNDLIHSDSRVAEVLLPIRDGLMIARKLKLK
jgi:predicted O-methyltransferase YrrM